MKFFIPLSYVKFKNYWRLGNLYGPCEDDKAVKEEIAHHWPDDKTGAFLIFDGQIVYRGQVDEW